MPRSTPPPLLYADSETNADQLYFGGVFIPDPFLAFGDGRRRRAVLGALEFNRARREGRFDEVLALEEWREQARRSFPGRTPGPAEVMTLLARRHRIRRFRVAPDFPLGVADRLRELGVQLEVAEGGLFPERELKTEREAAAIAEGNRLSALGFAAAERLLRAARIRGRRLVLEGRELTVERVKFAIETAILAAGGISPNTIVAGGDQACDPHCRGSGPLRPHELIIIDIFPRVIATGYHGDMTRTYLKGRASDAQAALVAAVRQAQRAALGAIRAGVTGKAVHSRVVETFDRLGYATTTENGVSRGFFHGTGHGLGLAVHEAPRLSVAGGRLRAGHVVTVEPGLYYPGLGGCRIEDVVRVTREGCRPLSRHHYRWQFA